MAVVGRRFPGMTPTATMRITKSITPSTKTSQVGSVPTSGNGHSTDQTPIRPARQVRPGA